MTSKRAREMQARFAAAEVLVEQRHAELGLPAGLPRTDTPAIITAVKRSNDGLIADLAAARAEVQSLRAKLTALTGSAPHSQDIEPSLVDVPPSVNRLADPSTRARFGAELSALLQKFGIPLAAP